jgi:hypothetical protein
LRKQLRAEPEALCQQAPAAFDELRKVLPAPVVDELEQQIDVRFIKRTCQTFLRAEQELRRFGGPPPADLDVPTADTPVLLHGEVDITDLEILVREMEREISLTHPQATERRQTGRRWWSGRERIARAAQLSRV